MMFQLGKTIISEDIIKKDFVCNLSACKGACCIDGDAGAPLEKKETALLEEIYPKVKPYLRQAGINTIESQGKFVITEDGEYETPLINGADCAYVIFDEHNKECALLKRPIIKETFHGRNQFLAIYTQYVLKITVSFQQ